MLSPISIPWNGFVISYALQWVTGRVFFCCCRWCNVLLHLREYAAEYSSKFPATGVFQTITEKAFIVGERKKLAAWYRLFTHRIHDMSCYPSPIIPWTWCIWIHLNRRCTATTSPVQSVCFPRTHTCKTRGPTHNGSLLRRPLYVKICFLESSLRYRVKNHFETTTRTSTLPYC